jgi:hypothetical protein
MLVGQKDWTISNHLCKQHFQLSALQFYLSSYAKMTTLKELDENSSNFLLLMTVFKLTTIMLACFRQQSLPPPVFNLE